MAVENVPDELEPSVQVAYGSIDGVASRMLGLHKNPLFHFLGQIYLVRLERQK